KKRTTEPSEWLVTPAAVRERCEVRLLFRETGKCGYSLPVIPLTEIESRADDASQSPFKRRSCLTGRPLVGLSPQYRNLAGKACGRSGRGYGCSPHQRKGW